MDSTYIHVSILNFRKQIVADRYRKVQLVAHTIEELLEIGMAALRPAHDGIGHHTFEDLRHRFKRGRCHGPAAIF